LGRGNVGLKAKGSSVESVGEAAEATVSSGNGGRVKAAAAAVVSTSVGEKLGASVFRKEGGRTIVGDSVGTGRAKSGLTSN